MKRLQNSKSNLTIFATCKPWHDEEVAIAQWNALKSWTLLAPRPEIVVYGNEFGSARMARDLGVAHRPSVETHRTGIPYVSSLFELAQMEASAPLLCYINADIIMAGGLTEAAQAVLDWAGSANFMMVGRRFDVPALVGQIVNMDGNWRERLIRFAVSSGELHNEAGLDWFMFRCGSMTNVPRFLMARTAWDNWMLLSAGRRGFKTVDATDAVFAVHQADTPGIETALWRENRRLWEQENPGKGEGTTAACNWRLDKAMNITDSRREQDGKDT